MTMGKAMLSMSTANIDSLVDEEQYALETLGPYTQYLRNLPLARATADQMPCRSKLQRRMWKIIVYDFVRAQCNLLLKKGLFQP